MKFGTDIRGFQRMNPTNVGASLTFYQALSAASQGVCVCTHMQYPPFNSTPYR